MMRTTGLMFVALVAAMLVVAAVGCASCQVPPPGPGPGTGGTVSTGGAPGTGGLDATGGAPPATGGAFAMGGTLPATGGAPSDSVLLCSHLARIGCPEGEAPDCEAQVDRILELGPRASLDLDCVMRANTITATRACESVLCGGDQ